MNLDREIVEPFILNAIAEDIGHGDHTSLSTIPAGQLGKAKLLIKDSGIIAGIEVALQIFKTIDSKLDVEVLINDGQTVNYGDIAFYVSGSVHSILKAERLVLNTMQRMSGIASKTNRIVKILEGTGAQVLDTRKTTPGIRYMEKWAVRIGGGHNHRFALYDMIMLKDNHVDYAGGIRPAIEKANQYLLDTGKSLKIEIEVRNEDELKQVLEVGKVDRIMLDNFSPERIIEALKSIPDNYEVEASGGITLDTIRAYAETGVDFISVGALTHSFKSLDMSLKAIYA